MKSAKLPAGARIDLGGIVKGWAVRRWAAWLRRTRRLERGLVNAGGDLAVWGGGPDEAGTARPWRIGIEHPWASGGETGLLLLGEGASATSGTLGRRWETPRGTMHHLIDPATMRPSDSDVVQCTASGGDLVDCEVWAKTLCILGSEAGLALLARARPPVEMLLFSRSGDVIFYGDAASLGTKWQDVPVTRTVASDH